MVGRGDDHSINILARAQLAIIMVDVFVWYFRLRLAAPLVFLVDVADGHSLNIALILVSSRDVSCVCAHSAAHSDEAEIDAVIRAQDAPCGGGLARVDHLFKPLFSLSRNQRTAGRQRRRADSRSSNEFAASGFLRHADCPPYCLFSSFDRSAKKVRAKSERVSDGQGARFNQGVTFFPSDGLDINYSHYDESVSLFGTPENRRPLINGPAAIGVNEIGCLIDLRRSGRSWRIFWKTLRSNPILKEQIALQMVVGMSSDYILLIIVRHYRAIA